MFEKTVDALRRLNRLIALIVGVVLALTVVFILVDITLRQFGRSFGGSDEISGYVMAMVASWGLPFALLELAHVRIDLLRLRLATTGRSVLDILAISTTAAVTSVVAWQAWPVLEKTIDRGSRANTPLETPLWIPQAIWFSGWVWFAVVSTVLLFCAIGLIAQRRTASFERSFGTATEMEA
ncbi:TRAP transporter small permease subunit [Chelativorans alearense]|uniref:TRAP transporter small permease subunit n=1 Tax=Chelativorans alearense TaxID=2681495 RepID=UPI0013D0276F|nr:TRAP transporter small permease [Chelativorans alearense]